MKTHEFQKIRRILVIFLVLLNISFIGFAQNFVRDNKRLNQNVTFRVDMSERIISPLGIHLAGSFNNWNTDSTEMSLAGNNVYQVTISLPADSQTQYKFINGNSWVLGDETVPAACGVPNGLGGYNRYIVVLTQDTILKLVCFSRCDSCPPLISATFRVSMAWEEISPAGVHIAGTFNNWDPGNLVMAEVGNGSVYQVAIGLAPGDSLQYKYINGNDWTFGESVPPECGIYAGPDNYNRYLVVPSADTILPIVCFEMCTDECAVGVHDLMMPLESISVYPNPSSDKITISTTIKGNLSILNLNSQKLMQQTITEPITTIDIRNLPSGVYFVRLTGERTVQVGKIIKQ